MGASPKRSPVTSESTSAKPSTRRSSPISFTRGSVSGPRDRSPATPQSASSSPSAPPSSARSMLSRSSSPASRVREAPSAERIVTSRRRPAARASMRLATLAQATSRTRPTAPMKTSNAGRISPIICSRSATTSAPQLAFDSGYCASSRRMIVVISCWARSSETPCPRRPKTVRKSARRGRVESVASGVQTSTGRSSWSCAGTMPTTV